MDYILTILSHTADSLSATLPTIRTTGESDAGARMHSGTESPDAQAYKVALWYPVTLNGSSLYLS